MLFYQSVSTDPCFNLALEDHLFSSTPPGQDLFLLWRNSPSVIVGKYQNTWEEVDLRYLRAHDIPVVRRLSGGGAVYHDLGNVNYTFITDAHRAQAFRFSLFTRPVLAALEGLGLKAQCSGRNDITAGGRKLSGSAQYIRAGRLLHHGCVMVDTDLDALTDALRVEEGKIRSKSIKSVRSRVTTVNACLEAGITPDRFRAALAEEVDRLSPLQPAGLTEQDLERVCRLRGERYASWEWNYGASPRCDIRREGRFPFGGITLYLTMEAGRIRRAEIRGDFFGQGDLDRLERALEGRRLDPEDLSDLRETDLSGCIAGLEGEQLIRLLCG